MGIWQVYVLTSTLPIGYFSHYKKQMLEHLIFDMVSMNIHVTGPCKGLGVKVTKSS